MNLGEYLGKARLAADSLSATSLWAEAEREVRSLYEQLRQQMNTKKSKNALMDWDDLLTSLQFPGSTEEAQRILVSKINERLVIFNNDDRAYLTQRWSHTITMLLLLAQFLIMQTGRNQSAASSPTPATAQAAQRGKGEAESDGEGSMLRQTVGRLRDQLQQAQNATSAALALADAHAQGIDTFISRNLQLQQAAKAYDQVASLYKKLVENLRSNLIETADSLAVQFPGIGTSEVVMSPQNLQLAITNVDTRLTDLLKSLGALERVPIKRGVLYDPALMEIEQAVATDNPQYHNLVAQVVRVGYRFRQDAGSANGEGQLYRKASVKVFIAGKR